MAVRVEVDPRAIESHTIRLDVPGPLRKRQSGLGVVFGNGHVGIMPEGSAETLGIATGIGSDGSERIAWGFDITVGFDEAVVADSSRSHIIRPRERVPLLKDVAVTVEYDTPQMPKGHDHDRTSEKDPFHNHGDEEIRRAVNRIGRWVRRMLRPVRL